MRSLEIKIDIKELTDYSASLDNTPKKKTLLLLIESFAQYILNLYGRLIEEAVESRRYRGKWEPVDEAGYLEYLGVTPSTNILYLIKESLEVVRVGYYFVVRFNHYYKYPGTSISLLKVLRAIEFGTSDFNARPILVRSARDIEENILTLWKGYLNMKGVIN